MPAEIKRSVSISGHRTSISLERPFWDALKEIACTEDVSVNELVRRIDESRDTEGNLSGAVRVYVLAHFKNKTSAACT
ncbi:MAG: ribbon-helix-helix domain-containing protein [Parvibaculum sp.]|uniref:ribbon-helix-helix domain-containing protein n=1 Tax=Parvibaculum sp. TaxID=2024848 RepID=UPI0025F0A6D5|nr:ribbon-helix-helix domain-containing protein [Parvibaculum sp.]MCE9650831.1 ribbon-helix-helix domain-containing protein [Parvibaculum sp.]